MELTASEQKALKGLVRQEKRWRWWRYVSLALSLGIVVAGIWWQRELTQNLISTTRKMSFTESPTGLEVFFASRYGGQLALFDLIPAFGGGLFGLTIARWRGNRVHQLLIAMSEREARR